MGWSCRMSSAIKGAWLGKGARIPYPDGLYLLCFLIDDLTLVQNGEQHEVIFEIDTPVFILPLRDGRVTDRLMYLRRLTKPAAHVGGLCPIFRHFHPPGLPDFLNQ